MIFFGSFKVMFFCFFTHPLKGNSIISEYVYIYVQIANPDSVLILGAISISSWSWNSVQVDNFDSSIDPLLEP